MIVRKLRIRVVSPFYYYTYGGIFADTGPFLGDIALMYALGYALGYLGFPSRDRRLEDLRNLPFVVSVGRPELLKMKGVIAVSSSFENSLALYKEIFFRRGGSILYKNVRRIRPVDVGSEYVSYYFSRDLELPDRRFGVRFGVQRDGVLDIRVEEPSDDDEVWMNAFTLRVRGIELDGLKGKIRQFDVYNAFYTILKGLRLRDVKDVMEGVFDRDRAG